MWGYHSLGSRSRKTIIYSSHRINDSDESSEEECIEVYLVEKILGHIYLDISHSYLINSGGRESCGRRFQDTSQSASSNNGGCGIRSIFTSHSSSYNCVVYVDISESISQETKHSSSRNQ